MNQASLRVHNFRTTFFWPLVLSARHPEGPLAPLLGSRDENDFFLAQQQRLQTPDQPWRKVDDNLLHLAAPARGADRDPTTASPFNEFAGAAYGEYVYFHDFVQRALFGGTSGAQRNHRLTLFQRTDIEGLEVNVSKATSLSLKVERVNLYLVQPGAAILAVQCALPEGSTTTLEEVMAFNDAMRRTHVPYFFRNDPKDENGKPKEGEKSTIQPGGYLFDRLTWTRRKDAPGQRQVPFGLDGELGPDGTPKHPRQPPYLALLDSPPEDRRVLPLDHWQWLIGTDAAGQPLLPLAPPPGKGGFYWRHFSDDRTQTLSTITLATRADYYALSEGSWMRLAFVDRMGTDPHPYNATFLRETFADHCYDRYHHPRGVRADAPSRYLMSDYSLTLVNYASGNSYAREQAVHMQRHYFQMFLLLVIDKAVMLQLSSRISSAIDLYDAELSATATRDTAEQRLTETLQELERDFLHYVHRFRFTGVSGQLQAGEMYARMRRVMKLDSIFDDIKNELETAVGFLSSRAAQRSTEAAHHATEAAERLNVIASLGVVGGLAVAFMALEGLLFLQGTNPPPAYWQRVGMFGIVLLVLSAAALGIKRRADAAMNQPGQDPRPGERVVTFGLAVMAGLGAVLAAGAWLWGALT